MEHLLCDVCAYAMINALPNCYNTNYTVILARHSYNTVAIHCDSVRAYVYSTQHVVQVIYTATPQHSCSGFVEWIVTLNVIQINNPG